MDFHTLVQRLIDSPEVVTHSKGDGTAHLASPMPNMLTLCGIEYDSLIRGDENVKACRKCAKIHLARTAVTAGKRTDG
jgi:hypothetical protein